MGTSETSFKNKQIHPLGLYFCEHNLFSIPPLSSFHVDYQTSSLAKISATDVISIEVV
jgi:hypothetical protein